MLMTKFRAVTTVRRRVGPSNSGTFTPKYRAARFVIVRMLGFTPGVGWRVPAWLAQCQFSAPRYESSATRAFHSWNQSRRPIRQPIAKSRRRSASVRWLTLRPPWVSNQSAAPRRSAAKVRCGLAARRLQRQRQTALQPCDKRRTQVRQMLWLEPCRDQDLRPVGQ